MTETFGIDRVASGFPELTLVEGPHHTVHFDPDHTGIILLTDSPRHFSLGAIGSQHIKLVKLTDRKALVFANLPLGGSFFDGKVKSLGSINVINTNLGIVKDNRVDFWWIDTRHECGKQSVKNEEGKINPLIFYNPPHQGKIVLTCYSGTKELSAIVRMYMSKNEPIGCGWRAAVINNRNLSLAVTRCERIHVDIPAQRAATYQEICLVVDNIPTNLGPYAFRHRLGKIRLYQSGMLMVESARDVTVEITVHPLEPALLRLENMKI